MSLPAVGQAQMLAEQLGSLGSLASAMTLVAPETLRSAAADVGFAAAAMRRR
jgi:hypothetical protein